VEQSASSKAVSHSASQEICYHLLNYHVYKRLPLVPVLSHPSCRSTCNWCRICHKSYSIIFRIFKVSEFKV